MSVACLANGKAIFTVAMVIKSLITLFLGLVIQLSQVQLGSAAEPVKSCGSNAPSVCCCDGLKSCPCAKDGKSDQKRSPMLPGGGDLKWLVLKASVPVGIEPLIFPLTEPVVSTGSQLEARSAYAGVPLSVAFFRFVI